MVDKECTVTMSKETRVGFVLPPGHWLGGKNYLRNLFAAIQAVTDRTITPVIFTGKKQQVEVLSDFPGVKVVATSMFDRKTPAWLVRKITEKGVLQDLLLRKFLQRHDVSVLSHSLHLGRQTSVKTIGWIPDFQHIHLPQFFTPEERIHRDREFMSICTRCDKIVVSSECARADLLSFAPEHAHKTELLRFVASPVPLADAPSLPDLRRLYGFNSQYFLLPNQFWTHKNHRVVVSALQKLKQQNKSFQVLATGSSKDFRNPTFFPSLMQYAADCNVLDCFRVLGQIPFEHLAGLMQHATAFINPSRFEGWSTSVEEAKSMGKQIVLSDIPVHREQAPPRGLFFPPEDPEALAEAMVNAHNKFDSHQDIVMQEDARAHFLQRQREFGRTYQAIVKKVVEPKPPHSDGRNPLGASSLTRHSKK
jgi:glycosyltransferase involved in cell wall biosynthesis